MPSYDEGYRRQARRSGRERGCWLYVPAAELEKAGYDPDGPAPLYRTWGRERGTVLVRLYQPGGAGPELGDALRRLARAGEVAAPL